MSSLLVYGRWSNGGAEATAFALRALVAINPQDELIEPVTNWLIRNRRGTQWSNTGRQKIARGEVRLTLTRTWLRTRQNA